LRKPQMGNTVFVVDQILRIAVRDHVVLAAHGLSGHTLSASPKDIRTFFVVRGYDSYAHSRSPNGDKCDVMDFDCFDCGNKPNAQTCSDVRFGSTADVRCKVTTKPRAVTFIRSPARGQYFAKNETGDILRRLS